MVTWLRRGFAVALIVAIVAALTSQWADLSPHLADASAGYLLGGLALVGVALLCAMLGWRVVLADLGSPLHLAPAARIYFVGQVGKYLPGSVWPVIAQMEMGRDEDVPRSRMGVSFVVSLALSILIGLVLGLPALLAGADRNLWLGLAVIAVSAPILLMPPLLNGLLDTGLRLLRRPPLDHPLSRRTIVRSVAWYTVSWLAFGAQLWLLVVDLGAEPVPSLTASVGAYCVAATLGVLFIVAPAGAGVREVLIVVGLSPVLGTAPATAAAVLSRALVTLGDVVAAGTGAVHYRRHRATAEAATNADSGGSA